MSCVKSFILVILLIPFCVFAEETYLRDNLKRAQPGDYIVTAQGKMYTILLIRDRDPSQLVIEEISIPISAAPRNWRYWIENNAPSHTAWVMYNLDLDNTQIHHYYSFTKNAWFDLAPAENILSTLLNLRLTKVPPTELKKIGPAPSAGPDLRRPWQPKMIVNGCEIKGVAFAAWHTTWPQDASELSGKEIEVYVPEENEKYPSYFPYWLQVSGMSGNAQVRIIDSGTNLKTTKSRPSL